MTPATVQKYLSLNLFEELGLDAMTPDERKAFVESFGNVIQSRMMLRLMKELTDEQKDKLDKILSDNPEGSPALADFLKADVPHFPQIVEEEIAGYKKQLAGHFA